MNMGNYNKILEAVSKGINIVLDDYDDIDTTQSSSSDIIDDGHMGEYAIFMGSIKKILTNDPSLPRKLDQIRVFKQIVALHERHGFLYKVHTLEELKSIIATCLGIWRVATNNFNWIDVSSLTSLKYAFSYNSDVRDKIGKVIIDEWDVSNVTDMTFLAWNAKWFEADLSKWDVSNVVDMGGAFLGCKKFNSDLSKWDIRSLKNAGSMFLYCDEFNSDLSKWNTSSLIDTAQMFKECKKFNSDLSKWDVSNVQNANMMFWDCEAFDQDLSKWNLAKCNNGNRGQWFRQMFEKTPMEYKYDSFPPQMITPMIQSIMKKK